MVIENQAIPNLVSPTPFADITDEMLRRCEMVGEAIALFSEEETVNPPYSILLADAAGNLAHLEVGNFGIAVVDRYSHQAPGAVFAVNCYLSQELVQYNAPHTQITNPENNNGARREQGRALAEQLRGELCVETLAALLSDHKNRERDPTENPVLPAWGYSICNHGTRRSATSPPEDLPWGTVSGEIFQPSARTLWYAYGWPCGGDPEYGDQLFQERSWGKFVPFPVDPDLLVLGTTALSTPEGDRC